MKSFKMWLPVDVAQRPWYRYAGGTRKEAWENLIKGIGGTRKEAKQEGFKVIYVEVSP